MGDETESNASSSVSNVASIASMTEPVTRQYNVLEAEMMSRADFRICMTEREFHVKIAKEKKTVSVIYIFCVQ